MKKIIAANIGEITPILYNEHPGYEHLRHEVTDSRDKYEAPGPEKGGQTVVAFYTLPPGKSAYSFHYTA